MGNKVTVSSLTSPDNSSFIPELNALLEKLADQFDDVLYRDGSQDMQSDLNTNSNRVLNLPQPAHPTEPVRLQELLNLVPDNPGDPLLRFDLSGTTGSDLVGFSHSNSYASSTLGNKLKKILFVTDAPYLAKGDNTTVDTAALQSAIDSGVKHIVFPEGSFKVGALSLTGGNIHIAGFGRKATKLIPTANTVTCLSLNSDHCSVTNIAIEYPSAGSAGAVAIDISAGFYSMLENIYIKQPGIGVRYRNTTNSHLGKNIIIEDATTNGVYVDNGFNVLWDAFFIVNGSVAKCSTGCIRIINGVEGCNFTNGHTYKGTYSLSIASASYGLRARPAANVFQNVYFDSAKLGALVDKAVDLDFNNVWFGYAGHNDTDPAVASSGLYLGQVDDIRFIGGGAKSNYANGVTVSANAKRVRFTNFTARDNSLLTANTYSGIVFDPNCSFFSVVQCSCGSPDALYVSTSQKHGILINAGVSLGYVIAFNQISGNATSGIQDNAANPNSTTIGNW